MYKRNPKICPTPSHGSRLCPVSVILVLQGEPVAICCKEYGDFLVLFESEEKKVQKKRQCQNEYKIEKIKYGGQKWKIFIVFLGTQVGTRAVC